MFGKPKILHPRVKKTIPLPLSSHYHARIYGGPYWVKRFEWTQSVRKKMRWIKERPMDPPTPRKTHLMIHNLFENHALKDLNITPIYNLLNGIQTHLNHLYVSYYTLEEELNRRITLHQFNAHFAYKDRHLHLPVIALLFFFHKLPYQLYHKDLPIRMKGIYRHIYHNLRLGSKSDDWNLIKSTLLSLLDILHTRLFLL